MKKDAPLLAALPALLFKKKSYNKEPLYEKHYY